MDEVECGRIHDRSWKADRCGCTRPAVDRCGTDVATGSLASHDDGLAAFGSDHKEQLSHAHYPQSLKHLTSIKQMNTKSIITQQLIKIIIKINTKISIIIYYSVPIIQHVTKGNLSMEIEKKPLV